MADHPDHEAVRRAHGFHPLRVARVVDETSDTRSFVLEVPDDLRDLFAYRAGQFCTFRVHLDERDHLRCYSMSSAPPTDPALTVTVKRVPGGVVSNWLNDHLAEGDTVEATRPAGVFCVQPDDRPVLAYCGGSGITPVISVVKEVLATTARPVRLLYANRGPSSVIFRRELDDLVRRHSDRLVVAHHLDSESGHLSPDRVVGFAEGLDEPDVYVCGPTPFMDLVEAALLEGGVRPHRLLIERFSAAGNPAVDHLDDEVAVQAGEPSADDAATETVTVILEGRRTETAYHADDTLLETARRAGLSPPYSCEAGNCATCMAILQEGTATMRANTALTPDEVAEGWVLTCQALPRGRRVEVEYEEL